MPRTPQPLASERETRLYEAAAEAFLEHGFEAAFLNRIIDAAGMRKSSFYHYFSDKRGLHERLLETLTTIIADQVHPPELATLDASSFWPSMRSLLDDLGRMVEEHPETVALARVFYASGRGDAAADRMRSAALSWTCATLARGVEFGVVRDDVPVSLLADLAIACFIAIDRWALDTHDDPDAATHAETAVESLRQLLERS